jgi:hypothetical protein
MYNVHAKFAKEDEEIIDVLGERERNLFRNIT